MQMFTVSLKVLQRRNLDGNKNKNKMVTDENELKNQRWWRMLHSSFLSCFVGFAYISTGETNSKG